MSDTPQATPEERKKYTDNTSPDKTVSGKAMTRLNLAADAIAATKRAIQHQGNQIPALQATNLNSRARLSVMRSQAAWEYTPEAAALAAKNKEADVAARADLAHGGNCGEHSWVAYHYLREHGAGETINRVAPSWIDHAFVIIGDLKKDTDQELAASDPWVNKPVSCLWEDHFATGPRENLNARTMVADGQSFKSAICAGLKLSKIGEQMLKETASDEKTQEETTTNAKANHYWNHDDARAGGHEFHYKPEQPAAGAAAGAAPGARATEHE
ncbi:MAG: hypothetical protein M4D80_34180 [Myxococcota bacterium]|nr:hypothetical protein [Myxococcota bacterium]